MYYGYQPSLLPTRSTAYRQPIPFKHRRSTLFSYRPASFN